MSVFLFQLLFVLRTATLADSFEISRYQPQFFNSETRPGHPRPANESPTNLQLQQLDHYDTDVILQLILHRLRQHSTPPVKSAISSNSASLIPNQAGLTDPARPASEPPDKYIIPPRLVPVKPTTPPLPPIPVSITTPLPVSDPVDSVYTDVFTPVSTNEGAADFDDSINQAYEFCSKRESKHFCLHGGRCIKVAIFEEKTCLCPSGYSGKRCETVDHKSYFDNYFDDDEAEDDDYFVKRSKKSANRAGSR